MKIVLRATFVLGLGLFQTIVAYGQVPKAEIFGGYSYFSADTGDSGFGRVSLHGWGGSVTGNINSAFGITGQITGNYGTPSISTFAHRHRARAVWLLVRSAAHPGVLRCTCRDRITQRRECGAARGDGVSAGFSSIRWSELCTKRLPMRVGPP